MSFEEKGIWLYLVMAIVLPIVYVLWIVGQASSVPVVEIEYQVPLLLTIGAAIGLSILGMIAPFGLAMVEVPQFWIANAMYAVFIIAAICGATVKLVLYRRGF